MLFIHIIKLLDAVLDSCSMIIILILNIYFVVLMTLTLLTSVAASEDRPDSLHLGFRSAKEPDESG